MPEIISLFGEDAPVVEELPEKWTRVKECGFGFYTDPDTNENHIIRRYIFSNQNRFVVEVMNYGATITSIRYPDKEDVVDDVVLGYDFFKDYLASINPYFGSLLGRVTNRIKNGTFRLNEHTYELTKNAGNHHIHGGVVGYDKVLWDSVIEGDSLVLSYYSKDGEENYPGGVLIHIIFSITTENELTMIMKATATKPTPIALSNRCFINLAGHATGAKELYQHIFQINADRYTETDDDFITTGKFQNVRGTLWDLRRPILLKNVIQYLPYGGYDQSYSVFRTHGEEKTFVARVIHLGTGRTMEVYSNQPGVQFYTANHLPLDPDLEVNAPMKLECDIKGKKGVHYYKHGAFCLQTQSLPDSVNHKHFPKVILKPCQMYYHLVTYRFGLYEEVDVDPIPTPLDITIGEDEGEARFY